MQVNAPFSGQNYLPLSVASLWSYYRVHGDHSGSIQLGPIVYKRGRGAEFEEQVHSLSRCDLVAASMYTWNEQYTLELLRRVREISQDVLIVVGGPQVPDVAKTWLNSNSFIDAAVHGEGEATFTEIVDTLATAGRPSMLRNLAMIAGVTTAQSASNGDSPLPVGRPRFRELDLPSPFLDGTFDEVIARYPSESWMVLWETNRGCPFSCTFCDWGSATNGKVARFPIERIKAEIDWIASHRIEFVFACDANFGLLPRDVEIAQEIEKAVSRYGFPKRVSTQGAKNVTDRSLEVQTVLTRAGVANGAALSMQSLHPATLKAIKRDNISLEAYWDLQQRYRALGIPTYVDLILGLPMETRQSFIEGVGSLLEYGQHDHIQFNNLSLLPNAAMSSPSDRALYQYDVVRAPVRAVHGSSKDFQDDTTPEFQELVVGTNTMRGSDWRFSRAFAWFVALSHLNKLVQMHTLLTRSLTEIPYSRIFEHLMKDDRESTLGSVLRRLMSFAEMTQRDGIEYFTHPHCLDIYWTADEYMFIDLVHSGDLETFVTDVEAILSQLVIESGAHRDSGLVCQAFRDLTSISLANIILPGVCEDAHVEVQTNALQVIEAALMREFRDLAPSPHVITVDRTSDEEFLNLSLTDWARRVVWFRNKRGAYTYADSLSDLGIPAGHYR